MWADNRLMQCMEKACVQAGIPRLYIANWQQITVSIVKTKFGREGTRYFDIGRSSANDDNSSNDNDNEEIDDDIQAMTRQQNHIILIANRAYSNQHGIGFGSIWDGLRALML